MKHLLLILLAVGFFSLNSYAQRNCATMEYLEIQEEKDPAVKARMQQVEEMTQQWIEQNPQAAQKSAAGTIYKIPVVVHVVYNTTSENISTTQINSQITVLNEDFRRLNSDASNTPSYFADDAADVEVEFCLASVDPSGGSTSGITRTSTSVTSFSTNDDVKYTSKGGKDAWPTDKYLNIWVCDLGGGVLGYAQFPGGGAYETDGVVIGYKYFGTTGTAAAPFDKGRTATHEVGHWFNLRHIWGDATCGNDYVDDTPTQQTSNTGCPGFPHSTCSNYSDMFMNYMDYTDDGCMNLFSLGQKSRMRALFASGGFRESLLSSPGCGGSTGTTYCASNGKDASYEWVARVQVAGIDNSTGSDGGYADYTAISTDLEQGAAYSLTLTPGFASSTYDEYWKIWIDYNQDGDFADAGELVYDAGALSSSAVSGSFTVPTTALAGATRMRVSMKYNAAQTECESFSYGEVEDYTVNIKEPVAAYCASNGKDASYEWIKRVQVAGIDNATGSDGGYADFTAISTDLAQGAKYNLTLTPGFASSTYDEYWKIWIDYNQDGDFADAGELVYDAGALSSSAVSGSFTVPTGALTGATRMRVSMKYNAAQTACESFSYGEVEDYTVNIIEPAVTYCDSKGSNSSYEWINRIIVGSIDNTSGDNGGYEDYTAISTSLTAGTNYTITLYPGFSGSAYDEYWKVWIDFNQDGDFADAGELAFDAGGLYSTGIKGTLVVPSTAKNGKTRMRVSMKYNAAPGPCETFSYGEVEDYTVDITGGSARMAQASDMKLNIYPNPAKTDITIFAEAKENTKQVSINVYDAQGRLVKTILHEPMNGYINYSLPVEDFRAGVYSVVVQADDWYESRKVTILK